MYRLASTLATLALFASPLASASPTPATADIGNPYTGTLVVPNPGYVESVVKAAAAIKDPSLKIKALSVARFPTFYWLDSVDRLPQLKTYLKAASLLPGKPLFQIVIYDLPDRDCSAHSSSGEFSIADGGADKYKAYIDSIAKIIAQYPKVRVVAAVEPDGLANVVTNLAVPKCGDAAPVYKSSIAYAIQKLNLPNVWLYLDAGHAGWLGWPGNLDPAAQVFGDVLKAAGPGPNRVRGLVTNVSNYNAYNATTPDPITIYNPNYDELHYHTALAPSLEANGFPAHFIVDQGRAGQQDLRQAWGDWCNILGAGFGTRPTGNTGSPIVDQIVWVKPGGESDGGSDATSPKYDATCGLPDATQPAPEAGNWFQAYFETLVKKANPPLL